MLLREIMEVDFCIYDISLYLDTHPNDERAIMLNNSYVKKAQELRFAYAKKYGALRLDMLSKSPYDYVEGPWPWEIDYCGCY